MYDVVKSKYGTWDTFLTSDIHKLDLYKQVFQSKLDEVRSMLSLTHEERHKVALDRYLNKRADIIRPEVIEAIDNLFQCEELKDALFIVNDCEYYRAGIYIGESNIHIVMDSSSYYNKGTEERIIMKKINKELQQDDSMLLLDKAIKIKELLGRVPLYVKTFTWGEWS